MTNQNAYSFSDEQLLAYLNDTADDGLRAQIDEALPEDEALQMRLAALDPFAPMVADASQGLLEKAPEERLAGMLDAVGTDEVPQQDVVHPAPVRARWWWPLAPAPLAVALLLAFVGGLFVGRDLPVTRDPFEPAEEEQSGPSPWIVAAANYMKLNTLETFTEVEKDRATIAANVEVASRRLELDLTPATADTAPLYFQKSEILTVDGRPLIQLTYLHDSGTPVALYAHLPTPEAAAEVQQTNGVIGGNLDGVNVTYWNNPTYEFILLGDLPMETLTALAEELASRLPAEP